MGYFPLIRKGIARNRPLSHILPGTHPSYHSKKAQDLARWGTLNSMKPGTKSPIGTNMSSYLHSFQIRRKNSVTLIMALNAFLMVKVRTWKLLPHSPCGWKTYFLTMGKTLRIPFQNLAANPTHIRKGSPWHFSPGGRQTSLRVARSATIMAHCRERGGCDQFW